MWIEGNLLLVLYICAIIFLVKRDAQLAELIRLAQTSTVAGLASVVTAEVPQEPLVLGLGMGHLRWPQTVTRLHLEGESN